MIGSIGVESLRYKGEDIQELAMNRVADDRDTLLTPFVPPALPACTCAIQPHHLTSPKSEDILGPRPLSDRNPTLNYFRPELLSAQTTPPCNPPSGESTWVAKACHRDYYLHPPSTLPSHGLFPRANNVAVTGSPNPLVPAA
jgi:hypothetical protein